MIIRTVASFCYIFTKSDYKKKGSTVQNKILASPKEAMHFVIRTTELCPTSHSLESHLIDIVGEHVDDDLLAVPGKDGEGLEDSEHFPLVVEVPTEGPTLLDILLVPTGRRALRMTQVRHWWGVSNWVAQLEGLIRQRPVLIALPTACLLGKRVRVPGYSCQHY